MEESWVRCPFCGRDLTGKQEPLRIAFDIPAFIEEILGYAVHWSLYLFVLLASYLFSAFNPNTILYGWLIVPVVASFFVGYIITEIDTAIKMILASFLLHAGIMIVLLSVPLVL